MLLPAALIAALLLRPLAGCASTPQWRSSSAMRAPDRDVALALGDEHGVPVRSFDPASVPDPPEPTNLRPCCAFGADLKVHLGVVIVPGFALDNMRGLADVGPHRYNVAPLRSSSSTDPDALADENNGLLYTCRGGFLDLAHVRDYADLTVYLAAKIERLLGAGGVIQLAEQGGARRILVAAVDADRLAESGRLATAIGLAQWAAFQISTWHEIATWFGFASMSTWPEKMSSFSPEDLYSNMLGIRLAGGILAASDGSDETDYNNALNAWLTMALGRLQVTTKASATAAIYAVDGNWWDSSRRVPDWQLVRRRSFDTGPLLTPWIVSAETVAGPLPAIGCLRAGPPLRLRNPRGNGGVRFDRDVTVEIDVGDLLSASGFPFPRRGSRRITQADFPAILETIRRENSAEFGPSHDRPKG
jgi:hypothetical protein